MLLAMVEHPPPRREKQRLLLPRRSDLLIDPLKTPGMPNATTWMVGPKLARNALHPPDRLRQLSEGLRC